MKEKKIICTQCFGDKYKKRHCSHCQGKGYLICRVSLTVLTDRQAATKEYETMEETLKRLLRTTQGCRNDMHEPDEQGIKAVVSGYLLDNAFGDDPHTNAGEITIGIERANHPTEWFNLATLIALARTSRLINHL